MERRRCGRGRPAGAPLHSTTFPGRFGAVAIVLVLLLSSDALPDAGDLLGVDEVFEGREVFAALRAGGEEEVFGDVEESRRTRAFLVATGLDEEVSVDEIAD